MKPVAKGVWRLIEFPRVPLINVYMAGDVLIDGSAQAVCIPLAEELRGPDAIDPRGLGRTPLLGEFRRAVPDRGHGDAVESRHGG
jgi:hypothetical protein